MRAISWDLLVFRLHLLVFTFFLSSTVFKLCFASKTYNTKQCTIKKAVAPLFLFIARLSFFMRSYFFSCGPGGVPPSPERPLIHCGNHRKWIQPRVAHAKYGADPWPERMLHNQLTFIFFVCIFTLRALAVERPRGGAIISSGCA